MACDGCDQTGDSLAHTRSHSTYKFVPDSDPRNRRELSPDCHPRHGRDYGRNYGWDYGRDSGDRGGDGPSARRGGHRLCVRVPSVRVRAARDGRDRPDVSAASAQPSPSDTLFVGAGVNVAGGSVYGLTVLV